MQGGLYNHDDVPLDDDTTFVQEGSTSDIIRDEMYEVVVE
jgi:hypothetical protein